MAATPVQRVPSPGHRVRASEPAFSARSTERGAEGDRAWVSPGQIVRIGGCSITGGLLYIGHELMAPRGGGKPDPALIDPGLEVDHRAPDYAGAHMGYWPSYSTIAPACRAAYLQWLAGGRHAPDAYIGYVFLYFYGLERRLLIDAQQSAAARAERETLVAEVRRLLGIYGMNGSFRGYAQSLLAFMTADDGQRRYLSPPPARANDWDVPFELRLGLGQLAADARPVPADWALAWVRLHPEIWLRTPATRCPSEFDEVFTGRYRDRCGDGLLLDAGRASLGKGYHPASAGIAQSQLPSGCRVPDVVSSVAPVTLLRELARDTCDDLDAYSRYLGRHPDGAGTAAALALLPPGIERQADAATKALITWADDSLGAADRVQVAAGELLARWSAASPGSRPGKSDAVLLARALERHGLGLEPDVRFGGTAPTGHAPAVLFRRAPEMISAPSDGYGAAATLIQLGAAVASADGRVASAEQDFLEQRVVTGLGLAQDECHRLRAHLVRTLAAPPTLSALRKRASLLPDGQRHGIGQLLVALAASDGHIASSEIDLLARLFDLLGLDRADAYSQLHALSDEPLTRMRTAGAPAAGYAIAQQPQPQPDAGLVTGGVVLNQELIKARLAESARAASYLAEIFTDDDTGTFTAVSSPGLVPAREKQQAACLDGAHAALLSRLAAQPTWARDDVDQMAVDLGLMLSGALEALNEAAFEAVGEPVCEGSDPIDINSDAVKEMLS
ncbi:MAG TPA: TerB N-terminal domain-containing protein [Streptosporangiaceae bacterium]|nr:TerB N-terminal domain-containing protein [Streptosporangiaceae bacterium]